MCSLLVFAVGACSASTGSVGGGDVAPGDAFPAEEPASDPWGPLRISGDETEGYRTFVEMRDAADTVVVGEFRSFTPGRAIQGDASEDRFQFINGTVAVEEVIRGPVPDTDEIGIEFISSGLNSEVVDQDVRALSDVATSRRSVLFLRAKVGEGEAGRIRLVNSYGLVTSTDRAAVDVPLGETGHDHDDASVGSGGGLADLSEWSSLDEFIAALREG